MDRLVREPSLPSVGSETVGGREGLPELVAVKDSRYGTVANLVDLAQTHDVVLRLARLKPHVFEVLNRDGVIDRMGRENVHDTVYGAAQDFIES